MMSPNPIRIAIVGLGKQGKEHLDACNLNSDITKVVAVCDRDRNRVSEFSNDSGVACFLDVKDLVAAVSLGIEALIVVAPPTLYSELMPTLAVAGIPMMFEKPLGTSLQEASKLLQLCIDQKTPLTLAAQRRFHPSYLKVEEYLRATEGIRTAEMKLTINASPDVLSVGDLGNWRQHVGAMMDLGFHAIDLARQWFGELRLVSANIFDSQSRICRDRADAEAHLLFRTETGIMLRIRVGRSDQKSEETFIQSDSLSLHATRSAVHVKRFDGTCDLFEFEQDWSVAMREQLCHFHEVVRSKQNFSATQSAISSLITMQLIEEAYARPEYA